KQWSLTIQPYVVKFCNREERLKSGEECMRNCCYLEPKPLIYILETGRVSNKQGSRAEVAGASVESFSGENGQAKPSKRRINRRVAVFSASQGRDFSKYLSTRLDENTVVTGNVYSGAPVQYIAEKLMSDKDLESFTMKDFVVLLGGTNNFGSLSTELDVDLVVNTIKNILGSVKSTNLILCTIPHRYDLHKNDVVNTLIKMTNTKIRDIADSSKSMLLDLYYCSRRHHTRHGLHLNKAGKIYACRELSILISSKINTRNVLAHDSIGETGGTCILDKVLMSNMSNNINKTIPDISQSLSMSLNLREDLND
ncbi:hypothetical protein LSTR_LSTR016394, partial [Laodelphax striatellus]